MADYINLPVEGGGSGSVDLSQLNVSASLKPLGSGQDDAPQIAAAIEAAKLADGGVILLQKGQYSIQTDISPAHQDYMCGIRVIGGPDVVLSVDADITTSVFNFVGGAGNGTGAISNTTRGNTSITFTVHANAGFVKAGDILVIKGTDSESNIDVEWHEASADGNASTGVVTLIDKLNLTLTSASVQADFGSEANDNACMDNSIEDLTIELNFTQGNSIFAIYANAQQNFTIRNVRINGWANNVANNGSSPIQLGTMLDGKFENIYIDGSKNESIFADNLFGCVFRDIREVAGNTNAAARGSIEIKEAFDCTFERIDIRRAGWIGFNLNAGTNGSRRNVIKDLKVTYSHDMNVQLAAGTLENILCNSVLNGSENANIYDAGIRNQVINCRIWRGVIGIWAPGTYGNYVGNTVSNTTDYGTYLPSTCVGANLSNNCYSVGGGNDPAIALISATGCKISDNLIKTWTGKGIYLESSTIDCLVDSNLIYGTSSDGIKADDTVTNCMISNNHLRGLTLTTGTGANDFINNKV